ncbi:hypothetical protein CHLRE_06g300650v5 [Chlamydomonas reinhardtii]|uniref:Uncharacterized protein n=1 Tax=Chlamydomonas reinhardtii TaxID=3055 RepID=A0A2K3DQY4_CHLRE|nr:uncharacterized protein CHLRE_06g300650v5 [Chlamydomonas reinhardtii]PNW82946.1 hypothetical protein CHLRE_06g300650v5 [Chlamydomonas reinhardtii]
MDRLIDVAGLLQAARHDMKVGQMIHGEAFSLFEAMSALEAGNPKMDAAASPAADRPTLDALLADLDLTAPLADLGAAGLLAVLDQLLAMEASWHTGSSAMQTVYGCLYMLRMERVKEHDSAVARALYAFCRSLQCECAAVRDLIIKGGVCEEEDMNLLVGGIPFEPPAGADAEALAALDAAIAEQGQLAKEAEEARLTGNSSSGGGSGGAVHSALRLRLQLRRVLHVGLREAGSDDPAEVVASAALFKEARELLPKIGESASLASPLPPQANGASLAPSTSSKPDTQQQQQHQLPRGFYVDANRHLLGPAPPRQVQIMSLADSLSYFDRLFDHLALAVVVSEQAWDYRSLQLHVWRFARLKPAVVARSMLHWLISPDRWQNIRTAEESSASASSSGGGGTGRGRGGKGGRGGKAGAGASSGNGAPAQPPLPAWVLSKAMIAGACLVAVKPGLPEEVDMFLEQAVIAASNWFQALLMNRCRCRRRLRRCLEDWLNMFHHGFNADVLPAFHDHLRASGWRWRPIEGAEEQGPFSTWVEYETAATMLHHLLMGFELELYEPREYDMIVWYCDYLCSQAVSAGRELVLRAPPPTPPQLPGGLGGGRGAGGRGGGRGLGRGLGNNKDAAATALAMARYEKSQAQHRYELVELEAFQLMCSGLVRLLVGLRVAGSIPEPPFPPPFNGGAQRFDQRFGAFFTMVRPVPLSHAEFVESMNPGDRDASFLFSLASRAFAEARARCAALKTLAPSPEVAEGWVKGLDRAAALNQVVSGVLAAKAAAGGKIVWTSDFSHHPYFPAISLPKPTAAPAAAKEGAEKK